MRIPDYLGIGSIKSGTTWVADTLANHPQVFMAHGKELHYFTVNYARGNDWYLKHFSSAREELSVGEYSVSYMDGRDQTAQRIYEFNPGVRLIVTVRNPVERAFSHYRWMKQMGEELPSFRESLVEHPELMSIGRYAEALKPYWRLFPQDQFHYIRQSDISTNPGQVARDLYTFLGVNPDHVQSVSNELVGETIQPRIRTLENLRIKVHHAAMKYGAGALITLYRQSGLSKLYRQVNNDPSLAEKLDEQDRAELAPLFSEDLAAFRAQTGISIVDG